MLNGVLKLVYMGSVVAWIVDCGLWKMRLIPSLRVPYTLMKMKLVQAIYINYFGLLGVTNSDFDS
jgi:hypothetical protein